MEKIITNSLEMFYDNIDKLSKYVALASADLSFSCCSSMFSNDMGLKNRKQIQDKLFCEMPVPAQEMADKINGEYKNVIASKKSKIYFCSSLFANNERRNFVYKMIPIFNNKNKSLGIIGVSKAIDNNNSNIMQAVNDLHDIKNVLSIHKQFLITSAYPGLSHRESECLFWLLRGRSAAKIGEELCISQRTVDSHLESIKNKFSCGSRREIFDTAVEMNLLSILPII
jgi:DNA-binding CsgD family transcriptional regulator